MLLIHLSIAYFKSSCHQKISLSSSLPQFNAIFLIVPCRLGEHANCRGSSHNLVSTLQPYQLHSISLLSLQWPQFIAFSITTLSSLQPMSLLYRSSMTGKKELLFFILKVKWRLFPCLHQHCCFHFHLLMQVKRSNIQQNLWYTNTYYNQI